MQPSRRYRSIGRAIYTVLPIVVTLMLLPTIAYATPPDPWWIAGIYDGVDGDDIVTLVYETSGSKAAARSLATNFLLAATPISKLKRRPI